MLSQDGVDHRIMEVILRSPNCLFEKVVLECPGLTLNQVFLAIDRLSRSGEVHLQPRGPGVYTLRLLNPHNRNSATRRSA